MDEKTIKKEIKNRCRNFLEPVKIPDRIILVNKIPRTITGKITWKSVESFTDEKTTKKDKK